MSFYSQTRKASLAALKHMALASLFSAMLVRADGEAEAVEAEVPITLQSIREEMAENIKLINESSEVTVDPNFRLNLHEALQELTASGLDEYTIN